MIAEVENNNPQIPARWTKTYELAKQGSLAASSACLLLQDALEELGHFEALALANKTPQIGAQ